jgi:hypothetical protein
MMQTQTVPATMRAMVLDEFGGDFRLEERAVPRPAPGEVLEQGLAALGRAGTLVVLGHVPGARLPVDPERLPLEELGKALALGRAEEVFGRIVLQVADEIPGNGS